MKKNEKNATVLRLYSLILIPVISVFIFHYLPMIGIVIAFKDYRLAEGIFNSEWVGLKNFEFFLYSQDFLSAMKNTVLLNSIFIFTSMFSALCVGICMYECTNRKAVKTYQTLFIIPHFVSWVVAGYMLYAFLNPNYGMVNSILSVMKIHTVDWYNSPKVWPIILAISNIWKTVGMDSILYYATLMGIDSTLFEAARIDGASKWQQIINITLPELSQLIVMLLILKVGGIFGGDFGMFYNLTRDIPALYPTTDVLPTWIFRSLNVNSEISLSAAAGLFQSFVGFLLVMTTNYIVKKIEPEHSMF